MQIDKDEEEIGKKKRYLEKLNDDIKEREAGTVLLSKNLEHFKTRLNP